MRRGTLKKETESLLTAAQDQALRTNYIKNKIDKLDVSPMCRMCGEKEETFSHITAECRKLAQNQYKNWRHDKVAQVIHWNFCKKFDLPCKETWYDHFPESMLENDQVKVLWDFKIRTDLNLDYNRPDIVVLEKKGRVCYIIHVACPFDMQVLEKQQEKL